MKHSPPVIDDALCVYICVCGCVCVIDKGLGVRSTHHLLLMTPCVHADNVVAMEPADVRHPPSLDN